VTPLDIAEDVSEEKGLQVASEGEMRTSSLVVVTARCTQRS